MNPEKRYYYSAYGLNIESCFPCVELSSGIGPPDITIHYGTVPESLFDAHVREHCFEMNSNQLILSVDGIARYLVTDGEKIVVTPEPDARDEEIRLFLLGSAFGALLHQRGLLPLHGSAIEVNGGCVAFLGHSGVGKSTLVAAFRKLGYRVMADDICVVSVGCDCVPMIFPSYPQLKLCVDAAKKLSEKPKLLSIADPTLEKHSVPIQEEFCQIPLPLSRLYMLTTTCTQTFGLTALKGVEKLRAIMNNTYRMCFVDGLDKKALHFTQCAAVAECVMTHHVTRPCEPFRLDELVELLVGDFEQCL